jgi:hypothetical protein
MGILRRLQAGEIDAATAAQLLSEAAPAAEPETGEDIRVVEEAGQTPRAHWRRYWVYPAAAGAVVLALGLFVVTIITAAGRGRGWLVCGWPLLVLGALVLVLSVWSRWTRWLHVRIREKGGKRIAISFPLPLGPAAWILRIVQPFVPKLKNTGLDDLIIAMRHSKQDELLHVQVQEGEDEDQVEVYIG